MAVQLLLYAFYTTGTVPNNLPSDGVRDFLAFLLFPMVLNRVESFPPIFSMCTCMDDLSVNLNKLYIGCLYAGTLINHLMYADDLCIFSPSVAGLRKLTDCCAKYGELFNITYNAKKSFCMVIDNKPQDRKHFHCIHLDNHPLPYTTKCKYLGHIINNNLTDDDDIARQKRCLYAQANCISSKILSL